MTIKHVISMSGGKDSQATIHYAQESVDPVVPWEDVELLAADTGNELSLTYDHWDYIEQHFGKKVTRLRRKFDREIAGKREYVLTKWAEKGVPDHVIERAAKINEGKTPAEKQARGRKAQAAMMAKTTQEQRTEWARKAGKARAAQKAAQKAAA